MIGMIIESFRDFAARSCPEGKKALDAKLKGLQLIATRDYPDATVLDLIGAVAAAEREPVEQTLKRFGTYFCQEWAVPRFRMAYAASGSREFLLKMQMVHQAAKTLAPLAAPPVFSYEEPSPDTLVLTYNSKRHLCTLATGLLQGVGAYYHEAITVRETTCMNRGDRACRFELSFRKA